MRGIEGGEGKKRILTALELKVCSISLHYNTKHRYSTYNFAFFLPLLPGSPATPGSPGAPFLPGGPAMPGTPSLPFTPLVPFNPGGPMGPGVPLLPGSPGVPSAPGGPEGPCTMKFICGKKLRVVMCLHVEYSWEGGGGGWLTSEPGGPLRPGGPGTTLYNNQSYRDELTLSILSYTLDTQFLVTLLGNVSQHAGLHSSTVAR